LTTSTTIGNNGTTVSSTLLDTMNGTSSATSATGSAGSSSAGANLQTTFLQLLITQMQNQDPTNPMDSSQMTSQIAQIDTVTGISQLNTSLSSLSTQINAGQTSQAALLLGSSVLAPGNSISVTSGTATNFGVQPAGTVPISWTPVDSSGAALPTGTYTITATGVVNGAAGTATTLTPGTVESVVQGTGGAPSLVLSNGNTVPLTSVAAVL
jgi:flagellar basal-body rod modification protein FlgD